jgi:hypothetical protein
MDGPHQNIAHLGLGKDASGARLRLPLLLRRRLRGPPLLREGPLYALAHVCAAVCV